MTPFWALWIGPHIKNSWAPQGPARALEMPCTAALQSAETAAKCKEWSYRPTDCVCRLFINNPGQNQASVALNSTTEYQRNFTSGEGEQWARAYLDSYCRHCQVPQLPCNSRLIRICTGPPHDLKHPR